MDSSTDLIFTKKQGFINLYTEGTEKIRDKYILTSVYSV